jgi:hypothetical protein
MILPYFNKGRLFFAGIYNHMGANLQEILKFILLNPGKVFAMVATRQNMIFFAKLLLPLSFFPVFNLRILIIAPVLLQHLLSLRQAEHDIYRHYSAELIPFIFISAVYGIKRFLNISYIKSNLRGGVFVCFLIAVAVTTNLCLGPHLFLLYSIGSIKKDVWDYQKEFFLSKIPKDAAVVATFEFLPKLSSRKNLYSFHNVSLGCDNYSGAEFRLPEDVEYALVDFNDSLTFSCFYNGEDSDKRIRDFIKNGGWGVLDISGTIVLMKKRHKDMYNLYKTTKRLPKNLKQCRSSANNELELIGYRIKNKEATAGGERIEIEFYWMVLKDKDSDYFVFSDILDEDGNIYCRYIRPLCYRVFPTYRWAKGQIVKEDYNLMVPYAIRNNSYLIRMGVFDHRDGRVYPMSSALHDSVDENGRVKILWKSPS